MSYALRKDVIFQDGEFRVNYERQGSRPHRRKWHTVDSNIPTSVQPLSHRPCRSTTPFTTTTTTTTTTPHIAAPKASMPPLMESLKPDTPATVRSSQSFQHKDRRKALQDDLLYKTRVSLDEFIEAFLPKLPKGVEVTSNFVTQMNKAKAWRGFLLPSDAGGKERESNGERVVPSNNGPCSQRPAPRNLQPKDRQPSNQTHTFTAKLFCKPRRTHIMIWLLSRSSTSTMGTLRSSTI
jgi:hypothetical protein